jgi:hypothetical protein
MTATKRAVRKAKHTAPSFHPASTGWQRACQLFPGFAALPTPVLVSLEPYAELIEPPAGPLQMADREAIAAAVVELVAGRPVAGAPVIAADSRRGVALAGFTSRLIAGAFELDRADLERLVRSGFTADEVRVAAETAIGFHVMAQLAHAAGGRAMLAGMVSGRNPACVLRDAPGDEPVRAA